MTLPQWEVLHGDCLALMREMADAGVDAVVCDPPAGIAFMSKDWDKDKGGRDAWIAWLASVMREAVRVMKPGAHALVWALPRTSHWTGMALEDAGFEVRDCITHLFGSGFPKSLDVSKAMDKTRRDDVRPVCRFLAAHMGQHRITDIVLAMGFKGGGDCGVSAWFREEHVSPRTPTWDQWLQLKALLGFGDEMDAEVWRLNGRKGQPGEAWQGAEVLAEVEHIQGGGTSLQLREGERREVTREIKAPATDLARQWAGWGTSLKPAAEFWFICRKPLAGTVAATVAAWGTGALNIDGCRIHSGPSQGGSISGASALGQGSGWNAHQNRTTDVDRSMAAGRWPPNVVLSHTPECREVGTRRVRSGKAHRTNGGGNTFGGDNPKPPMENLSYADPDGMETVTAWDCSENCPVRPLDEQSGERGNNWRAKNSGTASHHVYGDGISGNACHGDTGGASRFYYTAKASRREREAGLEGMPERDKANQYGDGLNSASKVRTDEQAANGVERGGARNHHPTVKPLALMRWLVRLVTPPDGLVLDPFCGSGSTGCAAVLEGFRFVGLEQDPEYCELARRRIAHWAAQPREPEQKSGKPGRWPPNVVLDREAAVLLDEMSGTSTSTSGRSAGRTVLGVVNDDAWQPKPTPRGGHDDSGGASRFMKVVDADLNLFADDAA